MKSFLRDVLGTIVLAIAIFFILQSTVQSFIVRGPSMQDSFHDEQRLIVIKSKVLYLFQEPERGDVIVFHPPENKQEDYIKRIIGLPGDTVEINGGSVLINGTILDEPYVKDSPHYTLDSLEVSEQHYFVLGDNRNNSNDSHSGWTVPFENILGEAWLSIWPPSEWGTVNNYSLDEQLDTSQ